MDGPSPLDSGDTPLSEITDALDADGFDGQFAAVEGGKVRCLTCRLEFDAHGVSAQQMARIEGESDPSDMAMLVPVECRGCGRRGTLILQYGPGADLAASDVLTALERKPVADPDDLMPRPHVTPGVTDSMT